MRTAAEDRGKGAVNDDELSLSGRELSQFFLGAYDRGRLIHLIVHAAEKDPSLIQYILTKSNQDRQARGRTIHVGDLPDPITKVELDAVFGMYGEIESSRVRRKTNNYSGSPHFAYVTFKDARSAVKALRTSNHYVYGNLVKVLPKRYKDTQTRIQNQDQSSYDEDDDYDDYDGNPNPQPQYEYAAANAAWGAEAGYYGIPPYDPLQDYPPQYIGTYSYPDPYFGTYPPQPSTMPSQSAPAMNTDTDTDTGNQQP